MAKKATAAAGISATEAPTTSTTQSNTAKSSATKTSATKTKAAAPAPNTKARASKSPATKAAATAAGAKAANTKAADTKALGVKAPGAKGADKKAAVLLTLTDIGDHLATTFDMPKSHAKIYLAEAVALIAKNLRRGNKVRISGLGVFEVKKRAARKGRNPSNGEPIKIKATKRVGFAVARDLKVKL